MFKRSICETMKTSKSRAQQKRVENMDVKISETHRIHLVAELVLAEPLQIPRTVSGKSTYNRETRKYDRAPSHVRIRQITKITYSRIYDVISGEFMTTSGENYTAHNLLKSGAVGKSCHIYSWDIPTEIKDVLASLRSTAMATFDEALAKALDTRGLPRHAGHAE